MITQAELKQQLDYQPDTGNFYWKISKYKFRIGKQAGTISVNNHCIISINHTSYTAHRLAWFYVHGELLPITETIYHINGDTLDNRIDNLALIPLFVHDNQPVNRPDSIEYWAVISEHPNYAVSNHGRVRNLPFKRILKHRYDRLGYCNVDLQGKSKLIHTLVAHAFLCKPSDQHVVNHINGIPGDNHVDNLEFVTRSENIRHAVRIGRKPGPRTGKRT